MQYFRCDASPLSLLVILTVGYFSFPGSYRAAAHDVELDYPPPEYDLMSIQEYTGSPLEAQRRQAVDRIVEMASGYSSYFGGDLEHQLFPEEDELQAMANFDGGEGWILKVMGGMLRQRNLSQDGFYSVLCHELGHFVAGYPYKADLFFSSRFGASAEGAADYFTMAVCLPRLFQDETQQNLLATENGAERHVNHCRLRYGDPNRIGVCVRSLRAAEEIEFIHLDQRGMNINDHIQEPSLTVFVTEQNHPRYSCRIANYYRAALCPSNYPSDSIPAFDDQRNYAQVMELQDQYFCEQDPLARRHSCWYHPVEGFGGGTPEQLTGLGRFVGDNDRNVGGFLVSFDRSQNAEVFYATPRSERDAIGRQVEVAVWVLPEPYPLTLQGLESSRLAELMNRVGGGFLDLHSTGMNSMEASFLDAAVRTIDPDAAASVEVGDPLLIPSLLENGEHRCVVDQIAFTSSGHRLFVMNQGCQPHFDYYGIEGMPISTVDAGGLPESVVAVFEDYSRVGGSHRVVARSLEMQ